MDTLTNQSSNMTGSPGLGQEGVGSSNSDFSARMVITSIVLPIICACGILGIILTVIVLSRKNMSTSTNCYLMGLAIADLLYLLIFATTLGISRVNRSHSWYYFFHIYETYATTCMSIFLMASIWLTVMLAIERYIAICRPFLATKMCTVVRARIFIVGIFIFALCCRLVTFWESKVVTHLDPSTNRTIVYLAPTDLAFNHMYNLVYPWLVDMMLASIVPFLLLLVLNARLIWEVRKSTHYIRRNLTVAGSANNVQREELQITIMLISVIIVFFICQAPYVIFSALGSVNSFSMQETGGIVFREVSKVLLTVKSAINFILYCWFSEKFWITLKRIFCIHQCHMTGTPVTATLL